jgi:hypothetical protein
MDSDNARIQEGLKSGEFVINKSGIVVCSTCGGNCGQCGFTGILGNPPADMQIIIDNIRKDSEMGLTAMQQLIKYLGL